MHCCGANLILENEKLHSYDDVREYLDDRELSGQSAEDQGGYRTIGKMTGKKKDNGKVVGDAMAILHWHTKMDGMDCEFVFGISPVEDKLHSQRKAIPHH